MMMHHGIVSHFNWQDKVMKEYLVEHWRKQAKQIAKMGIKVCFTGHFHAQDVSEKYGLTDMETGSTVSYPHPYRLIEVDEDKGTLRVRTGQIKELTFVKNSTETLQQKSERFANSALSSVMEHLVPKKVPTDVKQECGKVLGEAYARHLASSAMWVEPCLTSNITSTRSGRLHPLLVSEPSIVTSISMPMVLICHCFSARKRRRERS